MTRPRHKVLQHPMPIQSKMPLGFFLIKMCLQCDDLDSSDSWAMLYTRSIPSYCWLSLCFDDEVQCDWECIIVISPSNTCMNTLAAEGDWAAKCWVILAWFKYNEIVSMFTIKCKKCSICGCVEDAIPRKVYVKYHVWQDQSCKLLSLITIWLTSALALFKKY